MSYREGLPCATYSAVIPLNPPPRDSRTWDVRLLHRPIFEPITRLTRAYCQIIMPEWWECHECESINNPHLTPDACLACGHFRCRYCRRRGPSVGRTGVSNSGRKTHNLSEQNAASPGAGAKEAQEQAQEQVQGRKLP